MTEADEGRRTKGTNWLLGLIALALGYRRCRKPDGEPGWEWLSIREFRECLGCEAPYHQSWDPPNYVPGSNPRPWDSGLCPNCSGAD